MNLQALRKQGLSIALLAGAAGLGLYVFVIDQGRPTSEELDARKTNLVRVLRREELTELALDRGGARVKLVRKGTADAGDDQYHVVSGGLDELADQAAVDRLIQAIEFAERLRELGTDFDRNAAGLDTPRAKLSLQMGKITTTILLGAEAKAPRGAAYAEVLGEGVFVVSPEFARSVLEPIASFRSRTVLPYASSDLSAITLDGLGGHRRFVRGPWGGFRIETDKPGPRVNPAVFDRLLTAFADVGAERFLDDATADASIGPLEGRVTLTLDPKDPAKPAAVVEIGGRCPPEPSEAKADAEPGEGSPNLVVAVRRKPSRTNACVPASVLVGMKAPLDSFADHRLLPAREDEIEEIRIRQGDRTLELARVGQGWHLRSPEDKLLTEAEASGLLAGLLAIDGEVVPETDRKAAGLEPPRSTISIRTHGLGEEAQDTLDVEVGTEVPARPTEGPIALRKQDGVLLKITRAQAAAIEPSMTLLRSTALVDTAALNVQRVELTTDGTPVQIVSRAAGSFALELPKGFEADASFGADLFASLATLRADRWVADRDDGTYGLGKPRVEAVFEVREDGGAKTLKLLLGNEVPGGTYARFEPDGGVFVLPRAVETTLRQLVIDRSCFMVEPNEARAIELQAGNRKAKLVVRGEDWDAEADAGVALAEATRARVRRALTELVAAGVVHTGAAVQSEGFDKPSLRILVKRVAGNGARSTDLRMSIGRRDAWQSANVYYGRREGIDATFAIAASKVQPLIDAMQGGP